MYSLSKPKGSRRPYQYLLLDDNPHSKHENIALQCMNTIYIGENESDEESDDEGIDSVDHGDVNETSMTDVASSGVNLATDGDSFTSAVDGFTVADVDDDVAATIDDVAIDDGFTCAVANDTVIDDIPVATDVDNADEDDGEDEQGSAHALEMRAVDLEEEKEVDSFLRMGVVVCCLMVNLVAQPLLESIFVPSVTSAPHLIPMIVIIFCLVMSWLQLGHLK